MYFQLELFNPSSWTRTNNYENNTEHEGTESLQQTLFF